MRLAWAAVVFPAFLAAQQSAAPSDWIQLFNGRDLAGWTPKISGHDWGVNFANTFRVEGGLLKVVYDGYQKFGNDKGQNQFGHLFYEKPFTHYVIAAEYRFTGEQAPQGPGWAARTAGSWCMGSPGPACAGTRISRSRLKCSCWAVWARARERRPTCARRELMSRWKAT